MYIFSVRMTENSVVVISKFVFSLKSSCHWTCISAVMLVSRKLYDVTFNETCM